MAILILGSSGNLGQYLINRLTRNSKDHVFCIDINAPISPIISKNITYIKHDFLSDGFPDSLVATIKTRHKHCVFLNLIAKDYPVLASISESALYQSPFGLSLDQVCDSYRTTLGSSYKLIQEVERNNFNDYHVIFVGSIYGMSPPNHSIYNTNDNNTNDNFKPVAYSLAKSSQIMLLQEAVRTIGEANKRFNMISFGGIDLDQDLEFKKRYNSLTPSGSMVKLEEVYSIFEFMISGSPISMNGANIVVDGGWTCAN